MEHRLAPGRRRIGRPRVDLVASIALSLAIVGACGSTAPVTPTPTAAGSPAGSSSGASAEATAVPSSSTTPDWFRIRMTDVRTGQTFAMDDFSGKVVLVETMAEWCPTCIEQQREVKAYRALLTSPDEVVSVSLDIDVHEDGPSLKTYATALSDDWRFAVAPLEVARALGNLYSAEYLNPPYSPMLVIDRHGAVTSLPYGVKTAAYLRTTLEPFLAH